MSYPPEQHLLRDLGIAGRHQPDLAVNTIAVTPGLSGADGVRLGVLATLLDVTGAPIALAGVRPDWIATSDLRIHRLRPCHGTQLRAETRPLRVGSRSVVVEAALFVDSETAPCATGRMAFARIPGSSTAATIDPAPDSRPVTFAMEGGNPLVDSIVNTCGMVLVGPGQLRFEKSDYVINSFGTVNGGVLTLAAEVAAVSAAGGGDALDLAIHYLEQIGDGPVAVTAEVMRDEGSHRLCAVRIEDRSTGRLVAVADVTVAATPE